MACPTGMCCWLRAVKSLETARNGAAGGTCMIVLAATGVFIWLGIHAVVPTACDELELDCGFSSHHAGQSRSSVDTGYIAGPAFPEWRVGVTGGHWNGMHIIGHI